MDMILDFLVEYYVWVLVISIFLILVLIGYIADQKRKLKKIKEEKNIEQPQVQQPVNEVVNTPINDVVAPNVETTPVNEVSTPDVQTAPINEVVTPVVEPISEPIQQQSEVIDSSLFAPIGDTPVPAQPVMEPVIETPVTEINNVDLTPQQEIPSALAEPITEVASVPETSPVIQEPVYEPVEEVIDINEPIEQIDVPKQEEAPVEIPSVEEPIIEVIDEPQNVVNTWEPELVVENKDIISDATNKDSI